MASTYTPLLGFNKPALGDAGWGTSVNNGFTSLADIAIAGLANVNVALSNVTMTIDPGISGAQDARNMVIRVEGALTANRQITVPNNTKLYYVFNDTTNSFTVEFRTSSGGITVPRTKTAPLRSNGTSIVYAFDHLGSLTLDTPMVATSGGTGQSAYVVGDILYASSTTALSRLAAVATGNVLRAKGVGTAPAWEKVDLTSDVTGVLPSANGGTTSPGYASFHSILPYGSMAPSPSTSFTLAANTIYYVALYITSQVTVASVNIHVSTPQPASTVRLGLYSVSNMYPATRLFDFGTVASNTGGLKTISGSNTIGPGYYYLAVCSDVANVEVRACSVLAVLTGQVVGSLASLAQVLILRTQVTTGNTFPATAGATGSIAASTGVATITSNVPGVYFEV